MRKELSQKSEEQKIFIQNMLATLLTIYQIIRDELLVLGLVGHFRGSCSTEKEENAQGFSVYRFELYTGHDSYYVHKLPYLVVIIFAGINFHAFHSFYTKLQKFVPAKYSILLKLKKLIPAKITEKKPRISRDLPPL